MAGNAGFIGQALGQNPSIFGIPAQTPNGGLNQLGQSALSIPTNPNGSAFGLGGSNPYQQYTGSSPQFLPSAPITPGQPAENASQIDASIRPFLTEGLRQAQEIFLRQQPSFYPGQTYVDPSQASRESLAAQEQIARSGSPTLAAGQNAFLQSVGGLSQTAGGGFLNSNPYQQQMMQAATRPLQQAFSEQVLPGISSLYSKSGRLGSGSMERALGQVSESYGRALGDVTSNLAGTQFQNERQLQQQAILGLTNVAQAAPSIYGQQFLPAQQLAQVGAQQEAIASQPLQEAMTRYAYQQRLPYEQLSGYLSSVYGSPLGSYGSQAQQLPQSTNRTTGALAGGLAGGLGGYALGQAFPSIGGTLGATGGAALGGLLGYGF